MKITWYFVRRELRFRWKHLLPFVMIAAALIFTSVSLITFQECAQGDDPIDYMTSPSYMILFSAFALIGFTGAKTCFTLYSESQLGETGTMRALGMKRRSIRKIPILLGFICILTAAVIAVPVAFLYIYLFVGICASGDMTISNFVPLSYKIPYGNVLITLILNAGVMMAGVVTGYPREKSIVSLLRRGNEPLEAENEKGMLPEEGSLRDYGRLFVRRSIKRCIRYNLIVVVLLILPMIFLLGASTFQVDRNSYTFALHRQFDPATHTFPEVTDEMIEEVSRIPGVRNAVGRASAKKGYGDGFISILIHAEDETAIPALREKTEQYAKDHNMRFEDSAVLRVENNKLSLCFQWFFLLEAVVLFAVGCVISFTLLKSRLVIRKRELSLLHSMGAREEDITGAVIPETVANYAAGAFISVGLGALGFWMLMKDGEAIINNTIFVFVLCLIFLGISLYFQIRASKSMTADILRKTKHRV